MHASAGCVTASAPRWDADVQYAATLGPFDTRRESMRVTRPSSARL